MRLKIEAGKQYSSFALIMAQRGEQKLYLLQWNQKWQVFNLIGGKLDNEKGDDNSPARTIYRELEEELGLRREEECLIVNLIQHINMKQFSFREQREKEYHFSIFEVDLFPRLNLDQSTKIGATRWLSTGRENIFVSKSEIENLSTLGGRPISITTRQILRQLGELPKAQTGMLSLPAVNMVGKPVHSQPVLADELDQKDLLVLRLEQTENALRTLIAHSQMSLTNTPPSALEEGPTQSRFQRLIQRIPAIVCELAPDGTIMFVNDAITAVTGYLPSELLGQNWWRIFHPEKSGYQVNELYRRLCDNDVQDYVMELKARNGRYISVRWTTTNQYGDEGRLARIIAFGIEQSNPLIVNEPPLYHLTGAQK